MNSSTLQNQWNTLSKDSSGGSAIGGARSARALKEAQSSDAAIMNGRQDALKGFAYNRPAAPPPITAPEPLNQNYGGGGYGGGYRSKALVAPAKPQAEDLKEESAKYDQQSRFVAGRSFYINNDQWIDSEIQKHPKAKRVRVQFASPEYFDLVKKNPEALKWLSVGRNIQFFLNETIYEIYE